MKIELANNVRFKGDAEFGAKLLVAIDLAFFNLCDTCFCATSIDEVDYLCLSNLWDDILGNHFHEDMPTYLVAANKHKHDLEDNEPDDNGKATKKSKDLKDNKDKFRDLGDMVKNNQAVQDWILPGAKFKSLFTKDVIGSTPPFNKTGLITFNKWHVWGFCYEKCNCKLSYKKFKSVSHESAYDSWIKALKAKLPWQLGPTGSKIVPCPVVRVQVN